MPLSTSPVLKTFNIDAVIFLTRVMTFVADAVKYLTGVMKDDESIDVSNDHGRTCLHIAATSNNFPLVTFLIDCNASRLKVMSCEVRFSCFG